MYLREITAIFYSKARVLIFSTAALQVLALETLFKQIICILKSRGVKNAKLPGANSVVSAQTAPLKSNPLLGVFHLFISGRAVLCNSTLVVAL